MNFKQLIAHYETLSKEQLIQKLVDKFETMTPLDPIDLSVYIIFVHFLV